MTIQTKTNFAAMSYKEMQKEAAARGLKFIGIKTPDLLASLEATETELVNQDKPDSQPVDTGSKLIAKIGGMEITTVGVDPVIANAIVVEDASVSDKIRKLTAAGVERKDIAKLLNVRYQFVRNVQVRTTAK